ncbi:uncharacterized protein LOC115770704 [Drosophila novamexicana]|uniref:uncharacterized protein LOC115770704 n=1 Tax=Drosophila novamexicana TaxID=47314 RepID=UPI0011E59F0F|nr:uncharacterized protein LOC115770704 [Drosophila novamexicana]
MLQSNRVLQKEQADLYAIERKLVKVLPVVQEALNSLKVEELHLKSQSVHRTISMVPPSSNLEVEASAQSIVTPNEQINRQQIDLELFGSELQTFEVETDSD